MDFKYIPSVADQVFFLVLGGTILAACLSYMAGMARAAKLWSILSFLSAGFFTVLAFYVRR
jgi:hypothetical protein